METREMLLEKMREMIMETRRQGRGRGRCSLFLTRDTRPLSSYSYTCTTTDEVSTLTRAILEMDGQHAALHTPTL